MFAIVTAQENLVKNTRNLNKFLEIMKHKYKNSTKFQLPKGKYLITDPCYVSPDSEWSGFCDVLGGEDRNGFESDYQGEKFWVIGTAFGDGGYVVTKNNRRIAVVGVDSGLLSVIPLDLVKKWPDTEKTLARTDDLVKIVTVEEDSILECQNGDFRFGKFEVFTGNDELEEMIRSRSEKE